MNITSITPGSEQSANGIYSGPQNADRLYELVPCSLAQRQLWLLERLEPGSNAYLIPGIVRLCGPLDIEALQGAFNDCVARHESLRTAIVERDGTAWQLILPEAKFSFEVVDLPRSSHDENEALAIAQRFARTPLPLDHAPLARALLLKRGDDEFILCLVIHHIVFDGWSMMVLLRDLSAFYAHRRDPAIAPPADLAIQFADYSEWQREQASIRGAIDKAYWKAQLSGMVPFRFQRKNPTAASSPLAAGVANLTLTSDDSIPLQRLASACSATPFVILLAAFKILLWQVSGQDDIAVGVPTARRDRAEVQDIVGYLANTIVVRTKISPDTPLIAFIAQVREAMLGALDHADLPLDEIIQDVMPQRRSRQDHPFRVLFAMEPDAGLEFSVAGVTMTAMDVPAAAAKADLLFEVTERATGYDIRLEFDPNYFTASMASEYATAYRDILRYMAGHPAATLQELPASCASRLPVCDDHAITASRTQPLLARDSAKEAVVIEIWKGLFPHAHGDANEDFLEFGGSSLLAAHFVAKLRARLGIELPIAQVFEKPKLGDLINLALDEAARHVEQKSIQPVSRTTALPLSDAQMRMWFMQKLYPSSIAYTLAGAVKIEGHLDVARLQRAFIALYQRHEPLRTIFQEVGGVPVQVILPYTDVELPVEDLSHLSPAQREVALWSVVEGDISRPFDLAALPILRCKLFCIAPSEHVLLCSLHHIAGDAWSIRLLWRDLAALYAADGDPDRASLPQLGIQYADYAYRQKTLIQADRLQQDIDFWKRQLSDLPVLKLPSDRARPAQQSERGARFAFKVPAALSQRIRTLALECGVTRFVLLAACFQALLARLCDVEDIPIGVPVSCRDRAELHDLIGCFVNVIVLRGDLSGTPTFREFVRRLRKTALDAFAHQQLPFETLVDALQPARDRTRHPLFQVLFDFQEENTKIGDDGTLHLTPIEIDSRTSQFDLSLYLKDDDAMDTQLSGAFVYCADLFDPATVERMAGSFIKILQAITDAPDAPLSTHDLLSQDERAQLRRWNDTAKDYGPPALLDELIAAHGRGRPHSIAISSDSRSLSYGELLRTSQIIANRLRMRGAGPDTIIGVYLERGLAMPVMLLSILRSGAAYLPLDPELPASRLAFMLDDAAPLIVLTSAHLQSRIPPHIPSADADEWLASALADNSETEPERAPRRDSDLAYVIYTSGSTGQPKGVMIPHRGIVNRLRWMQDAYRLGPDDVVLQKTPYAFDVSVWEFFWPLLAGAHLVMAAPGVHRDPNQLANIIERHKVSTIHFVPSMLDAFLAGLYPSQLRSLRRVFVSGEALSPELRDRFLDCGVAAELHNLYGPTEASVDVTAWYCGPGERGRSSPIGLPIANVRIHILDPMGRETGIGMPGEICIGGIAVARGYLNRPELTQERFVPDPFAVTPDARLYRTGDRGRRRADGAIEYLGRMDFQVKLRGNRIELGEIEAVARRHHGVREAAAIISGNQAAEQKIVLFVTSDAGPIDLQSLRQHAANDLPSYMVPSEIIALPQMPLSVNGKLDRRALATIEIPHSASHFTSPAVSPATAPGSSAERLVAEVWQRVLKRTGIGTRDNFFDVGGNSLLLVQVHAGLREIFKRELTLIDMFRMPTIESLSAYLSDDDRDAIYEPTSSYKPSAAAASTGHIKRDDIAIIGMAGRFPGAQHVSGFWDNLLAGRESILRIDRQMLLAEGMDPEILNDPLYVPFFGALSDISQFDAEFFGIGPAEAARLDPQGRLLLECAWEALEDAGIASPDALRRTGVFSGGAVSSYALHAYASSFSPNSRSLSAAYQLLLGNDKDYLSSRLSYRLGLRGPSIAVQTACSTSLVAVVLAVQALRDGDCDVALAGGVSVSVPHRVGYFYEEGAITSPHGHCRAFDASADGTVPGNGAGIVVLKRLGDALRDRDSIHAVIRGVAVNNDGAGKLGFTSPSPDGQAEVILSALADAGASPQEIGYIETHGTGTPLGDQVELSALARVFDDAERRPVIGSVKPNVGHLDAAAGIAGLMKAALVVETGDIPGTLHFETPNPLLESQAAGFTVNRHVQRWNAASTRRLAGVSSFGIGGTNAHVIIEQSPLIENIASSSNAPQIIVLSARSRSALKAQIVQLQKALEHSPLLDRVAWTLQSGRRAMPWRVAIVARTADEANARLSAKKIPEQATNGAGESCFLLPGQGTQELGMGRALYHTQPTFRADVDACLGALDEETAKSVYSLAFADGADAAALNQTAIAQPALFILQYSLARLLMRFGIVPRAMIGHSLGEFVAAALSGVFDPADAIKIIALRGRLMQQLPGGAMAAILSGEADIAARLPDALSIAACNEPEKVIISGPTNSVDTFCAQLAAEGIESIPLNVSHAFHSAMMDPVVAPLITALKRIHLHAPAIPFVSTVTGSWITAEEAQDPEYWGRHLRHTVRFSEALKTMISAAQPVLFEVGAGKTLSGIASRHGVSAAWPALPLTHKDDDRVATDLMSLVARAWEYGLVIDWANLGTQPKPEKIRLPTYPFERQRFWIDRAGAPRGSIESSTAVLYAPLWQPVTGCPAPHERAHKISILTEGSASWDGLAMALSRAAAASGTEIEIVPHATGKRLLVPLSPGMELGGTLMRIASVVQQSLAAGVCELVFLTFNGEDVLTAETIGLAAAGAAAAIRVIAQEHPELTCRVIDLDVETAPETLALLAQNILFGSDPHCAIRGRRRFALETRALLGLQRHQAFREGGVYLITGSDGALARALASHLRQHYRAKLVLLTRRAAAHNTMPSPDNTEDTVVTIHGDVGDHACMQDAIAAALAQFGRLDGIFHTAGISGIDAIEPLHDMTLSRVEDILHPKLYGVAALARAIDDLPIDFVLLCSSLSTLLGGIGFAAYAAANRAMEAFALREAERSGKRWMSVIFDGINFSGPSQAGQSVPRQAAALDPAAAIGAIEALVASDLEGRLIVVAGDLERREKQALHPSGIALSQPADTCSVAPDQAGFEGQSAALVASVWSAALGKAVTRLDQDFFELGGDSLAAIGVVARLRSETGLPLTFRLAMQATTVAQMATLLDGLRAAAQSSPEYDDKSEMEEGEL